MEWKKVSVELCELLDEALIAYDCRKKKMFGCPAYFVNDNMFTGVFGDSIFARLSEKTGRRRFRHSMRLRYSNLLQEGR